MSWAIACCLEMSVHNSEMLKAAFILGQSPERPTTAVMHLPTESHHLLIDKPSHHYHDHHRHHLHRLPVLVSLHHKVNPCLDSKCLFISSLFRSEKSHSSWIFLQNSDKNKLWTLNYLLYIIIQKGIPAMGCLNAVLDEGWGSYGRDYIGRCYRELCFQCLSSYCCIFCRAEKDMMASRQERWWAL